MAGMGDNPLIGDYTKGISKGREYFVALQRRIQAEKADPKPVVLDLQMGLFKEANRMRDEFVSLNGRGRFGPKTGPEAVPNCVILCVKNVGSKVTVLAQKKDGRKKLSTGRVTSLQDLKLLLTQVCG